MSTLTRPMVVVVSAVAMLGAGTVLVQVLPSDFGLVGKLLILVIVTSALAMMASTLVWAFRSVATEKGYFDLMRASRPADSSEGRLWWWTRTGWYSWIALMVCLACFAVAAITGLLK